MDPSLTAVGQLRALAKSQKRPVRTVNIFDCDVCTSVLDLRKALENAPPPPDRLRYEVRVPVAERRFAVRANDQYLAIEMRGNFSAGVFSINRYPGRHLAVHTRCRVLLLILWLFTSGVGLAEAEGQSNASPTEKTPHKFFDRTNITLTVIESTALLADGIYTQRGLRRYPETSREMDPFARPFVSRGWPGQIAGGTLVVTADVGLRYWLHRKKRHRLERLVPLILITYGTVGAIHNARELRRVDPGT